MSWIEFLLSIWRDVFCLSAGAGLAFEFFRSDEKEVDARVKRDFKLFLEKIKSVN